MRTTPPHISLRPFSVVRSLAKETRQLLNENIRSLVEIEDVSQEPTHKRSAVNIGDGLSDEQRTILDLVLKKRQSVFFTGPAGTGKSFLLRKIIQGLTVKYLEESDRRIAITASTGLAAYSIKGITLHRFAGIGIGKAPTTKLIMDIFKDPKFKLKRWLEVKVLIIDEVSMIDPTLFDKLDIIARAVRGIDQPFGGIQLVITGDFFQLPPVLEGSDDGSPRFCFEAKAWRNAVQHTITLTKIYRQKDPLFAAMLNEIREGLLTPRTIGKFRRLNRPLPAIARKGIEPVELFPLRREADLANTRRMQKIKSKKYRYIAEEGGILEDATTRKNLLSTCPASQFLELKQGAQVMLIKNIDKTLVNGSQGQVVGFANQYTFFHDRWEDKDCLESQESENEITCLPDMTSVSKESLPLYPVVRFRLAEGVTRTHLCMPMEWAVERWVPDLWQDDGWRVEKLATRIQVPLILAWALSIHKAQGQTLGLVKVDLNRVFERGQAYVALSRASSIEGLQVLNFDPNKVRAHPKAKEFYASLSKI